MAEDQAQTPEVPVHQIAAQLHDLGRVKSNVADMVRQGAPESDIDAYIKAEGTTVDAIKALDQKSIGKYVDDIGRSLALGATFGFADKIAAAMDTLTGKGTYEENIKRQRAQSADISPAIKIPGEVTGAVASSIAAAPVTAPLAVATGAAKLPGIVRAIGSGAGIGAATAAGESDNITPGEIAQGAAIGGATGAVLQPIIAGVTALAKPVIRKVQDAINPGDAAMRNVAGSVQRDVQAGTAGMELSQFATAKGAGVPVANADIGGETTRALARSAANTSPEARAVLTEFANDRFQGQGDRATEFVRGIIGAKGDIGAMSEQIQNAARKSNAPAYKTAYDAGDKPVWSPLLERLSAAPEVQAAMLGAEKKWASWQVIDGFGAMNPPARVANGGLLKIGGGGLETFPNIQYWDYVSRDLRGLAQSAKTQGNREDAARYGGLAKLVTDELDKIVPQYRDARVGAAGFFGAENALEAGQNFLSKSVDINDANRALAKMSPQDRDMFKFGFAGSLLSRISQVSDRADLAKKIGDDKDARQRIALALGLNDGRKLMAFVDAEGVMSKFKSAIEGNSTTARQLVELGLAGGTLGYGEFNNDPTAMAKAALVYGLARGNRAINENVAKKVAEALTSDDPRLLLKGIELISKDKNLGSAFRELATKFAVRPIAQGAAAVGQSLAQPTP